MTDENPIDRIKQLEKFIDEINKSIAEIKVFEETYPEDKAIKFLILSFLVVKEQKQRKIISLYKEIVGLKE